MKWIKLDEALNRKKAPFPKPWMKIHEYSGVGNIGAELDFGTVPFQWKGEIKNLPARIIIFNVHKDVVGPIMSYWYSLWHKDYGYVEFDVRWIWKFLKEKEPENWLNCDGQDFTLFILERLGQVRELFLRCPEEQRNGMIEAIGKGKFLAEESAWPGNINV